MWQTKLRGREPCLESYIMPLPPCITCGTCRSVRTGGFISGGGFGFGWLFRKYGLGADNVLEALIVNVYGRVLDRGSMREDLFWAITGEGMASFEIIKS